ncbi:putative cysteine protease YraA [compost metagenome]
MRHFDHGPGVKADRLLSEASMNDYHALLVPGGLASPDTMRQSEAHLTFLRAFMRANKPVALICHGPWVLADAGMAEGRRLTSWPGIRRDLERAGATWVDAEVVRDGNLVTSRKPQDIPAFADAFIETLAAVKRPV